MSQIHKLNLLDVANFLSHKPNSQREEKLPYGFHVAQSEVEW